MSFRNPVRNLVLAGLSSDAFEALRIRLEPVHLNLRHAIQSPGEKIGTIYFFESAIVSIIAKAGSEEVEVGIIGRDGLSGLSVLHHSDVAPYNCFVQVAGDAYRIGADAFVE